MSSDESRSKEVVVALLHPKSTEMMLLLGWQLSLDDVVVDAMLLVALQNDCELKL